MDFLLTCEGFYFIDMENEGFFIMSKEMRIELENSKNNYITSLNKKYSSMGYTKIKSSHFEKVWKMCPFELSKYDNKEKAQKAWDILCVENITPTLEVIEALLNEVKYLIQTKIELAELHFSAIIDNTSLIEHITTRYLICKLNNKNAFLTYKEQLQHPLWQKKRLEIMQRDNFSCRQCGDNQNVLNVHHKKYISGNKPWEYPDEDLITLCETCHSNLELNKKKNG